MENAIHHFCALCIHSRCMDPGMGDMETLEVCMASLEETNFTVWAHQVGMKIIDLSQHNPQSDVRDRCLANACAICSHYGEDDYDMLSSVMDGLRDRFPLQYVCFTLQTYCTPGGAERLLWCIRHLESLGGKEDSLLLLKRAYQCYGSRKADAIDAEGWWDLEDSTQENVFISTRILEGKGIREW